jgi:hypothetical protein
MLVRVLLLCCSALCCALCCVFAAACTHRLQTNGTPGHKRSPDSCSCPPPPNTQHTPPHDPQ